jgi:hypothetical protein
VLDAQRKRAEDVGPRPKDPDQDGDRA